MSEKEMNDLMEKMRRVDNLMRRYQAYGMRAFGPFGNPHRGQGRVLALLKMQPEITQKELSYLLDMRQQSVSELLAKLEQKGYITRTPSEEDRRTTIIRLTEAGRAAAEKNGQNEPGMERIFGCLNDEEQANLGGYLDRLAEALEKELEGWEVNWKDFAYGMGWGRNAPEDREPPSRHSHSGGQMFGDFRMRFGSRGRGWGVGYNGPVPEGEEGFAGQPGAPEEGEE